MVSDSPRYLDMELHPVLTSSTLLGGCPPTRRYHTQFKQQSPTFWHQGPVLWKVIFPQTGVGDGLGMIQVHYIYCALYFCYYCISSTSDHQALGPGGWGPLVSRVYSCFEGQVFQLGQSGRNLPLVLNKSLTTPSKDLMSL